MLVSSSSCCLGGLRNVILIRLRKDRAIFGEDGKDTDDTESAPVFGRSPAGSPGTRDEQNGSARDVRGGSCVEQNRESVMDEQNVLVRFTRGEDPQNVSVRDTRGEDPQNVSVRDTRGEDDMGSVREVRVRGGGAGGILLQLGELRMPLQWPGLAR